MPELRPFAELRDSGLLWLINASVFHPRGFALSLTLDDDGNATGWSLRGNGSEAWIFAEDVSDEAFAATLRTFSQARADNLEIT